MNTKQEMTQVSIILGFCFFLLVSLIIACAPAHFTPTEKTLYTTVKTLETAKIFRSTGLEAAKLFWHRGLMTIETRDKIIEVADNLQASINDAATALRFYHDTNGLQGGADLENKIHMYQIIYGQFTDLIMPYLIKKLE